MDIQALTEALRDPRFANLTGQQAELEQQMKLAEEMRSRRPQGNQMFGRVAGVDFTPIGSAMSNVAGAVSGKRTQDKLNTLGKTMGEKAQLEQQYEMARQQASDAREQGRFDLEQKKYRDDYRAAGLQRTMDMMKQGDKLLEDEKRRGEGDLETYKDSEGNFHTVLVTNNGNILNPNTREPVDVSNMEPLSKVSGYLSSKARGDYTGTASERKEFEGTVKDIRELDFLMETWDPSYAAGGAPGKGKPLERTAKNFLARTGSPEGLALAETFGMDTENIKKGREWWKNYRLLYELPARHELFGATLTPGEERSWKSAAINENMSPEEIEKHLATLRQIATRVLNDIAEGKRAASWSTDYVDTWVGMVKQAPGMGGSGGPLPIPDGVPAEEWNSLSVEDQQYYMQNMANGKP